MNACRLVLLLCMSVIALACGGTPPEGGASETSGPGAPSDPEQLVLDDATMVLEVDVQSIVEASELPVSGLIAILDEYEGAEDTADLQEQIRDEWDDPDASLGTDAADVESLFSIRTQSGRYFVVKGGFDFQDIERELEARDFAEDTYRDHRIWEHENGDSVALLIEAGIYIYGDEDVVKDVLRAIARGEGLMEDEAGLRRALGAAGDGLVRLAMDCDAIGMHSPGSLSAVAGRLDESCESVAVVVSGGDEDETGAVIGYVYGSERRAESAMEELEDSIGDTDEIDADVEDIEVDGDIVVVKLTVYGGSPDRFLAEPAPTPESAPAAPPAPTAQPSPTPQPVRRPAPTPVPTARPVPAVFQVGIVMDLAAREGGVLTYVDGARIEIPADAVTEPVHVLVAEVAPPKSPLAVGRAFDFSVERAADLEKADLEKPVTVHIPFELEPGQDASSVRAVHWDELVGEWEPVPGVVDESSGTIAVTTDRLSIFSSLWVKVEASCAASPGVVGAGEKLQVVSRGTSLTFGTIDIYMVPSVTRAAGGTAIVAGSSDRSEVVTVGLDEGFELTYETVVSDPGEYRVGCRIFWESAGIGAELLSLDPPSAVVTVRREGGPAAALQIERIDDQLHPIYVGEKNSITVEVRNVGDERSGRFNLVTDFISTADGSTTRLYGDGPGDLVAGREDGIDPGATVRRNIVINVPDSLESGEHRMCAGIEQPGVSGGALGGGACQDSYVLRSFEDAMEVRVLPIETRAGRRVWVALPTDWGDAELLHRAIDWTGLEDDETLRELYRRVAGELAFRRAVSPGVERRHVLLQGLTEEDPSDIVLHITELCLDSGVDCSAVLNGLGLLDSGLLTELPEGARDAVGFGVQSVGGALLFGDAYFTMLVNQALDLDQALETLDQLESLPLGPIWLDAIAEARKDVVATASRDGWTAYAAAIVDNKEEFLQFSLGQTVSGLTHTAAKKQLLHHLGIAGQKAVAHALGVKIVGGSGVGASAGGVAAAGPALFVASVWFASEVYLSVEEKKERLGTAALAAFINAAYSDPSQRGHLREATAYAKYATYDNLVKSEEGWQQWLSSVLKLNVQGRSDFLEFFGDKREMALDGFLVLLSPESVEVDPGTLALAVGESGKLRARVTARSGRVVSHSGFEWTSLGLGTATVSEDGVVTGVAPGEAVIAARAGDVEASVIVEVAAAADARATQGGRIAFVSVRGGDRKSGIYVMNADGSGQTRLTDNEGNDWRPRWSPDGRRIAFMSDRNDNYEIYVMNADGSGLTRLTDKEAIDADPSWSPDGRRIAFESWRDQTPSIYVVNADGSGLTRLTGDRNDDYNPSWSPDGQRIAFVSGREIYMINADGSDLTRLTDTEASEHRPSWSPDGRRIAFDSHRDGNLEIYMMYADGSNVTRLTNNERLDWSPNWSPDGRHIAFLSNRDGEWEIYVMGADGSGQTRLTQKDSDYVARWFPYSYPSWSPDGRRIVFKSDRDELPSIYIVNVDGSGVTRLTLNETNDSEARWSPTGLSSSDRSAPLTTPIPSVAAAPTTAGYTEDFFGSLDSDHWLLYGTAEHLQSDGVIQLTVAQRDQLGFLLMRQPISIEGLKIEFSFEIGGGSGADGLGLLLLRSMPDFSQINPSHHAGGGWGSRYLEGYVVAFDTHLNRAGYFTRGGGRWYNPINDPSGNFVALAELGAGGEGFDMAHLATENLSVDLRDSGPFDVEVVFGGDGLVRVYLSNAENGTNRALVVEHTIDNFDPFDAYIGFIGATGGATDRHIIRSVRYEPAH